MKPIEPGPLPDPAVLARRLSVLVELRGELAEQLGFSVSVHRTLILLLAFERPIHSADVRGAVRSLAGTRHYAEIRRMRLREAAYRILLTLARRGGLEHLRGKGPAWFWLPQRVRDVLAYELAAIPGEPTKPAASGNRDAPAGPGARRTSVMRTRKRHAVR